MSGWVRVETRFISHPKVLEVGPLGEALWLRGLCYAGEQLTDGFVPTSFLKRMGDMKAITVAQRLVNAGLWQECEGGYQIHDYLDWQRSREEVADLNSKRAEAGRRGGKQKASNALANARPVPEQTGSKPLPDTDTEADTDGSSEPAGSSEPKPPAADAAGKPAAPKPKRVKTSFPENFVVTEKMREWAHGIGLTDAQIDAKTERFERWALKTGTKYLRWDLAWADSMEWEEKAPPRANGHYPSRTDQARSELDELKAIARGEA